MQYKVTLGRSFPLLPEGNVLLVYYDERNNIKIAYEKAQEKMAEIFGGSSSMGTIHIEEQPATA